MSYIGRAPTDTGEFRLIDEISSSFDGSTQSFDLKVGTLAITPTKENIIIALDGVLQDPSSAYTVSGSTIKFSEGPVSDTTFYGVLTGQVGASIANSTITNDHVSGTAAIDQSKLNLSVGIVSASAQLATDISGSLGTNAALIRSLTGAAISGSIVSGVSGSVASTGSFGSIYTDKNVNASAFVGDGSSLTGIDIPTAAAISGSFEGGGSTKISGSSTSTGSFGQIALGKQSVSPPSASNQTKIYAKKDTKPDNFTRLLIHSDNVDGSTAFADSGSFGYSIARTGSAAGGGNLPEHRSTQANFGNTSMYFTSSALLMITGSNDFMGGNSDFTLECWVKATTLSGLQPRLIGDSAGTWFLRIGDGGGVKCVSAYNGNWYAAGSEGEVSPNAWYHIAWTRSSGTNRFFLNGDLMSTTITDASMVSTNVYIGGTAASADLDGYMDEIRVSDIARWTDDFQGALPTEPYETDTNTKLLIHSDTRDRSPYFIDSSEVTSTRKSITAVGNAKHTSSMTPTFGEATSSIKFGSSAMYFDGSGDYLSIPAHDDFDFSQVGGSFTIDGWFNLEEAQDNTWACGYNSAYPPVGIYFNTTGDRQQIRVYGSTDGATLDINTAGEDVHDKVGSWMHLAIVSDGGSIKLYVDGEHLGPTVQKTPATNGAQEFWIGHGSTSNNPFKGWIDEFRVSRGIARWTGNFDVPKRRYPINENRLYVKSDDGIEKTIEVIQPYGIAAHGQVLKSAGEGGVQWGSSGITHASMWRLTTTFTGDANPISSNWEPTDTAVHASDTYLGTAMTESSGVFSFPSTGFWLVRFTMQCGDDGTVKEFSCNLKVTVDNSAYDAASKAYVSWNHSSSTYYATTSCEALIDVSDVSNVKVAFQTDGEDGCDVIGNSVENRTYVTFIRLGDV